MNHAGQNDEQLMLAYAQGDMVAFRSLYERHRGPLYRFLLRAVKERTTAEELFQDLWGRIIAARQRYQPTAKFSTWMLQIAHNLLIDHYRQRRLPISDGEDLLADLSSSEHERPEAVLSDFEFRRNFIAALEQLPLDQKEVFLLRAEQELSLEEIAEVVGMGKETVKSRLRYAVNKLKGLLRHE